MFTLILQDIALRRCAWIPIPNCCTDLNTQPWPQQAHSSKGWSARLGNCLVHKCKPAVPKPWHLE